MTKVEAVEREVENLTPDELASFRHWFAEYEARIWDQEFEEDVLAGRLDRFAEEALEEDRRGETTEI
jgi:hypothetical protein